MGKMDFASAFASFDRGTIASAVEVLVAVLDTMDGDPDLEDATDVEDDFALSPNALNFETGPGCNVSDTGDIAWLEDNRRQRDIMRTFGREDDEEDDDSGQCTEDEISFGVPTFGYGGPSGPGCPISDPGGCEHDGTEDDAEHGHLDYSVDQSTGPLPPQDSEDRGLMVPHLRRVRATACDKITRFGRTEYRLR